MVVPELVRKYKISKRSKVVERKENQDRRIEEQERTGKEVLEDEHKEPRAEEA